MADDFTVVRFSTSQNSAQIEGINEFKKDDYVKSFKEMELGRFYIVTILLSVVTFILDLYFHCWIAYVYYIEKEGDYFVLTLVFLVVPALVTTAFSMRWYLHDEDEPTVKRPPLWRWGLRLVMLVLQLAPLLRYCDTLAYGIMSHVNKKKGDHLNHQKYLRLMLDEETNASLLRLLSCFLMSAPQAIIQLVFLLSQHMNLTMRMTTETRNYLSGYQSWAIICSIMSISWALTSYHRSVRLAREDKEKLSTTSAIMMFCWNLFSTLSRVLALSLLATLYPAWFMTICAAHWVVMSLWLGLVHHQTAICGNLCEEIIFHIALGLAYVIAFISPKDGPTRYSYLAYYLVCFMENTAALVVWCVAGTSAQNPELHYGVVGVQISSFILCISFMVSYYKYYHPSGTSSVIRQTISITDPELRKT
ncbi:UNVERIFIED_CONTAM: hypothetical protein PYX00_004743 [Menopon gallinae]|uniref:XK-related protein n=1 Tax=Menopon gallinae TaxID=328185 RepID=A0AAW2I6M1_9NEOP